MFSFRLLEENDYEKLVEWWKWFRFPVPARKFLPEDGKGGVMITKDGIDIVAGFVFFTNSKLCWIEFIVSNPEYKNKDRKQAIVECIKKLCFIAKNKGYKAVFTSIKSENLIESYKKAGFNASPHKTTELTFIL